MVKTLNKIYYQHKTVETKDNGDVYTVITDYDVETRTVELEIIESFEGATIYSQKNKYMYNEKNLCIYYSSLFNGELVEQTREYNENNLISKSSIYVEKKLSSFTTFQYDNLNRKIKEITTMLPPPGVEATNQTLVDDYSYFDGYYLVSTTSSYGTYPPDKHIESVDIASGIRKETVYNLDYNDGEDRLYFDATYDLRTGIGTKIEGHLGAGHTDLNENGDPTYLKYDAESSTYLKLEASFTYNADGTLNEVLHTESIQGKSGLFDFRTKVTHDENGNVIKEETYLIDDQQQETHYSTETIELKELSADTFIPKDVLLAARKGNYISMSDGRYNVLEILMFDDELMLY